MAYKNFFALIYLFLLIQESEFTKPVSDPGWTKKKKKNYTINRYAHQHHFEYISSLWEEYPHTPKFSYSHFLAGMKKKKLEKLKNKKIIIYEGHEITLGEIQVIDE